MINFINEIIVLRRALERIAERCLGEQDINRAELFDVAVKALQYEGTTPVPNPNECTFTVPEGLHESTKQLIVGFATALAEKSHLAETKYGYSNEWSSPTWMNHCRDELVRHVGKGDPRDVALYCAFLWWHGESTTCPQRPSMQIMK